MRNTCPLTYSEGLHQEGGFCSQLLLLFNVVSHIAELLLHHPHSLKVGRVIEGVAAEKQQLRSHLFKRQICKNWGPLQL